MDSLLSFPVGLFHPLRHAGLSRRTPIYRQFVQVAVVSKHFGVFGDLFCLGQVRPSRDFSGNAVLRQVCGGRGAM